MIYTFMGVLIVALIIGLAIGGICFMSISKCCKARAEKRLRDAKQNKGLEFRTNAADSIDQSNSREASASKTASNLVRDLENAAVELRRPKVLKQLDTEDELAVQRQTSQPKTPELPQITEDDSEDNIDNILTARGLVYNAPQERRGTYQRASNPALSAGKRNSLRRV